MLEVSQVILLRYLENIPSSDLGISVYFQHAGKKRGADYDMNETQVMKSLVIRFQQLNQPKPWTRNPLNPRP